MEVLEGMWVIVRVKETKENDKGIQRVVASIEAAIFSI